MSETKASQSRFLGFFDNMCQRDRPLVWVATISKDGKAHLVPTCFVKPLDVNRVAIGCVFLKQTLKNVRRNNNVALAAAKFEDGYDGYMIKGTGEIFDNGEHFEHLKESIYKSTRGRRTISNILVVTVEKVFSLKPGKETRPDERE